MRLLTLVWYAVLVWTAIVSTFILMPYVVRACIWSFDMYVEYAGPLSLPQNVNITQRHDAGTASFIISAVLVGCVALLAGFQAFTQWDNEMQKRRQEEQAATKKKTDAVASV
jgi:hypothetical protein